MFKTILCQEFTQWWFHPTFWITFAISWFLLLLGTQFLHLPTGGRETGKLTVKRISQKSHSNLAVSWEAPQKSQQHTKFQSPTTLGWSWIPEMSVRGQISLWPKSGIPGWFIRRSLASAITKLLTEADPTAVAMGRIKATELPSSKWKRVTHNKP